MHLKKIILRLRNFFITIEFEIFFKYINFKVTTNSFKYSLVQKFENQFLESNYRGKEGIFFEKFNQFFQVYIPPYLGCGDILYEQHMLFIYIINTSKGQNDRMRYLELSSKF